MNNNNNNNNGMFFWLGRDGNLEELTEEEFIERLEEERNAWEAYINSLEEEESVN